jgi:hypothetical protein
MSPAPGMTHQKILGEIYSQIHNFLEGKPCDVFSAPFDKLLWKYVLSDGSYGKPEVYDNTGKPRVDVLPEFELVLLKVFGPTEEVKMPSPEQYRRF